MDQLSQIQIGAQHKEESADSLRIQRRHDPQARGTPEPDPLELFVANVLLCTFAHVNEDSSRDESRWIV
jgi:hypothetical protein